MPTTYTEKEREGLYSILLAGGQLDAAIARAADNASFADALAEMCELAERQCTRLTRRQCTIFLEKIAGKSYTETEGACSPIYMAEARGLITVFLDPPDSDEKWVTAQSFAAYMTAFDPRTRKEEGDE